MSQCSPIHHLEVRNEDVTLCFTCPNYKERIEACTRNLLINSGQPDTLARKQSFYGQASEGVEFRLGDSFADDSDGWTAEKDIKGWDAFFFENTDYPLHAHTNSKGISLLRLVIGKEQNQHVAAEDLIIFGSVNFKNQVGRTDISLVYQKNGEEHSLSFSTEVLSYKMDYRTDMRSVIRDIEEEFAMLSYSFLKETYLTFRSSSDNKSTDLIWWQIFRDCFQKITDAARQIIHNPKRRLQTTVRYERAERMPYMPPHLENEYEEFKKNPSYLYRMEEMYLSKDTVENRFLKYALWNILDRFKRVHQNVLSVLKSDNTYIRDQIQSMGDELYALANDQFFRGIGRFKGFTQDSLVMKQASGYRDVYECWIKLQCGYDLQEGVMQLEVKDISELYEIWCFVKVKNMVQHILRNSAEMKTSGKETTNGFVKTLVKGGKSEVTFFDRIHPDSQLASLMYNATTDDEECDTDESDIFKRNDIADTTSKTTEQRPDIVLRLTKTENSIQYTYLFDAKYRIRDTKIPRRDGVEVPPVDAINQLHRYRDAIYYTKSTDEKLKREVIGGYVLYPGNITKAQYQNSYYQRSVDEVNIGAFPLKPGGHWYGMYNSQGGYNDLLLDPASSEDVLYNQIKQWLDDNNASETLLNTSIPQKGLEYEQMGSGFGVALVMMENYEIRKTGFANGLIAIPLKTTESGMTLLEHKSDIGYVLFHTRNKNANKHFFRVKGRAKVLAKDSAEKEGYYLVNAKVNRYLCLKIDPTNELDSTSLDPSKSNFKYDNKAERYDAQYAELNALLKV